MCGEIIGKDQKVVHIDHKPSFVDFLLESSVHVGLECGRWIAKSEEHDIWFVKTKFSSKGGFSSVIGVNPDIVIPGMHVHFREIFCTMKACNKRKWEREGICVLNCPIIDVPVILTGSEASYANKARQDSLKIEVRDYADARDLVESAWGLRTCEWNTWKDLVHEILENDIILPSRAWTYLNAT
jgi:hypothetical protein